MSSIRWWTVDASATRRITWTDATSDGDRLQAVIAVGAAVTAGGDSSANDGGAMSR